MLLEEYLRVKITQLTRRGLKDMTWLNLASFRMRPQASSAMNQTRPELSPLVSR